MSNSRELITAVALGAFMGGSALADESTSGEAPMVPTTTAQVVSAGDEPASLKIAQVEWKKMIAAQASSGISTKMMLTSADEPTFLRKLRLDGAPTGSAPAMLASKPTKSNLNMSPGVAKKYGEALQHQLQMLNGQEKAMQATIEVEDFED